MTFDRDAVHRAAVEALGGELVAARQRQQVDDTVALVERAVRAWPIRDPEGWAREVVLLNIGRANSALARLIREHATTPTVGAFFDIYRRLDTTRPREVHGPGCLSCDSTGWIEASDFISHGHSYTASRPCPRCPDGAARERSTIWRERNG